MISSFLFSNSTICFSKSQIRCRILSGVSYNLHPFTDVVLATATRTAVLLTPRDCAHSKTLLYNLHTCVSLLIAITGFDLRPISKKINKNSLEINRSPQPFQSVAPNCRSRTQTICTSTPVLVFRVCRQSPSSLPLPSTLLLYERIYHMAKQEHRHRHPS